MGSTILRSECMTTRSVVSACAGPTRASAPTAAMTATSRRRFIGSSPGCRGTYHTEGVRSRGTARRFHGTRPVALGRRRPRRRHPHAPHLEPRGHARGARAVGRRQSRPERRHRAARRPGPGRRRPRRRGRAPRRRPRARARRAGDDQGEHRPGRRGHAQRRARLQGSRREERQPAGGELEARGRRHRRPHQHARVQSALAHRQRAARPHLQPVESRAHPRRHPRDPWWAPAPLVGEPVARPIRVALTVDPAKQGVHADVAAAVRAAGNALANAGYAVEEVEPPDVEAVATTWTTLCINELRHITQPYIRQYGGADINRSLDFTLAAVPDVDLDGYLRALALRARHVRDWTLFMERYPLVVGPVSTEPPFEVGFDATSADRHAEVSRAPRLLVAVNLLGFPAVSVPTGVAAGLPLGVQVIAGRYREDLCLDAAEVIEAQRPLLTPIDPVS